MMVFRKLSAASIGRLLRKYFTENRPEPEQDPAASQGAQAASSGERLTAYYTGRDDRATWRPDMPLEAAKALGIDPTRMPRNAELDLLFEGKRADTGDAWSKHGRKISAYDFTFSAHKSVTLAAEFAAMPAESAAIRNAVDRANDAAMRYIAREIGWARKGKGGEDGADPGAVGWASFRHHVARPTLAVQDGPGGATYLADAPIGGDPHDHIHNALFNLVATEDGRIGSLDTQRIHSRVHEFGAYGQAVLADGLRKLGIRLRYDKNEQAIVVDAIPDKANDAFSKGRRQVLRGAKAYAETQGLNWDDLSAERKFEILREEAVSERLSKMGGKNDKERWREQADAIGWAHSTVLEGIKHRQLTDTQRFDLAYAFAARHLETEFHTAAVLDADKLRLYAVRGLIGTGIKGPEDIDRVVELLESRGIELKGERVGLVIGMTDEQVRFTNTAQIRIEEDLARKGRAAAIDKTGALSTTVLLSAIQASGLDFESEPEHAKAQLAAIYALGTGGRLNLLTGVAGSGKTTLLQPLVAAWKADRQFNEDGREVVGVATAWRQANALKNAGIERGYALQPLLSAIESGEFQPSRNTVLVIDEVSQIGPRPMLKLIEAQARTGMTIKALGDREQAQAIEAGDTIEILRRVLPKDTMPDLLTTVRQETRRGREIAGLFRGVELDEYASLAERQKHRLNEVKTALRMKREDGTVTLAEGDQDQVVNAIADLYLKRRDILRASNSRRTITVSVPTNEDAADVSRAIRTRLKQRGEIAGDEVVYNAIDQRGERYTLPIATGDKVRLFRSTWARIAGRGGWIGDNGDVLEVVGRTESGLRLKDKTGRVGEVEWRRMTSDKDQARLLLGFGHALTIDAAQGITSGEHINALPRGSAGLTAFKAYVAESRSRGATWTIISKAAVYEAEKRSRALGDAAPITEESLWDRTAADMAAKPYKALGMDVAKAAQRGREEATDAFIQQSLHFQAMALEGRDAGAAARRRAQSVAAANAVNGSGRPLSDAIRLNDADMDGVRQAAASQLRGQRVRAFERDHNGEGQDRKRSRGGEARRLAQAEAVRKTLHRHVAGLSEAIERNAESLRGINPAVQTHLRTLLRNAEKARRTIEAAVRRPGTPTPGP